MFELGFVIRAKSTVKTTGKTAAAKKSHAEEHIPLSAPLEF